MIKKIVFNQNDSSDVRGIDENGNEVFWLDTNHSVDLLCRSLQANALSASYSVQVLKPKPANVLVKLTPVVHTWKNGGDNSKDPKVFKLSNGHYLIEADADTDADGSPRVGSIDPDTGQSHTSLRRSNGWKGLNEYVDSEKIPFFVLPMNWKTVTGDTVTSMGDMAKLTYKDKFVYAIFADQGPNAKIGEASICAIEHLGGNPWNSDKTKIVRGLPYGVSYEIIPGSKNLARTIDFDSIQKYGKELFESQNKSVITKKLMLNPGHAGSAGARGANPKIKEEEFNELQAQAIKKLLSPYIQCDIIRQNEVGGLAEVGKAAKNYDMAISLHFNGTSRTEKKEYGVGFLTGANPKAESLAMAVKICKALASEFNYPYMGKFSNVVTVTQEFDKSVCPVAFLLETEFIDDELDYDAFKADVLNSAEIIAQEINKYFKA